MPWDTALQDSRHRPSFIDDRPRPERHAMPGRRPALSARRSTPVSPTTPPAAHSPFSLDGQPRRRRPEHDRPQRHDPARLRGDPQGRPLLPGVGDRPARRSPGTPGVAEQAAPGLPRREPDRHRGRPATGAGTHPLYPPGEVYLAGPTRERRSASSSSSRRSPARTTSATWRSGSAICVDPVTAQVTTSSDPLPQILEGIPLRTRTILVNLDRPGFTLNPTNCDPFSRRRDGHRRRRRPVANRRALFQVANCADLGFAPKLGLKLKGSTKRRGHPALQATVTAKPGEANIAPDSGHDAEDRSCSTTATSAPSAPKSSSRATAAPPARSMASATVETPLLDQPLSGPRLPALLQQQTA